jgi:solute carrier family 25 (mitochondrial carnitine/acylcarnitine transporter), member 20/29
MFLPGAIQAATGLIVGYPFDTIKANMQKNSHKYKSNYDCLTKIFRTRGIPGFYRGLPAPLIIMMIKRGFQYDAYEKFNKINCNPYISGGIVGGLGSIIGCPMHYIKINMQIQDYKSINTLKFIKHTYKKHGFKRFYYGIKIDCLKEASFGVLYLGTYGHLRNNLPQTSFSYFMAGGISSVITWSILFPIDSLRTNIISNKSDNGIISNLKLVLKNQPISRLWKGLTPVLIRIFPVSALSMLTYESSRKLLS